MEVLPVLYVLALIAIALLFGSGYLAACAGSQRWLTFAEWWG